jgi:hypothetical protein
MTTNNNEHEHGQRRKSLSEQIGQVLSVPTYEALDAYAQVPHQENSRAATSKESVLVDQIIHGEHGQRRKSLSEQIGQALSVPTYEALDAYAQVPHQENSRAATSKEIVSVDQISHGEHGQRRKSLSEQIGQALSVPTYEALDAYAQVPHQDNSRAATSKEAVSVGHVSHGEHGQRRKSLSEQISDGVHHLVQALSVPTYEALDAHSKVSHQDSHIKKV